MCFCVSNTKHVRGFDHLINNDFRGPPRANAFAAVENIKQEGNFTRSTGKRLKVAVMYVLLWKKKSPII